MRALKTLILKVKDKKDSIISFGFAFALMVWLLKQTVAMGVGVGGDVTDIWKTITSFYSGDIQPSYVLYKGFLSVYPYVWFYELSKVFGVGSWFFIKIFHCFLFSYVSAIGFPYIVSKLLKIEIKFWRRMLVIFLMFILWKPNCALQHMMIDLPSLTLFVLSVTAALKIAENKLKTRKSFFIYAGLIMGMASTYTGQYLPAILLLVVYVLVSIFSKSKEDLDTKKLNRVLSAACLLIALLIPRAYNSYFEKTVVDPLRESGGWIPSSNTWTNLGLGQAKRRYNLFFEATIPNNRSLAIIKQDKGEEYEAFAANGVYSKEEVFNLIRKHPVDFITSWCNSFLLTVSMRGQHRAVLCLFTSYTALFLAMYAIFKRRKTLKDFFAKDILIIIGFISSGLVTCLMHFEPRYVMAFQGLFLSMGLLDDTLWHGIKNFVLWVKKMFSKEDHISISEMKFPYAFAIYVLFVIMCFTNYAALLENVGPDPSILFNWIY